MIKKRSGILCYMPIRLKCEREPDLKKSSIKQDVIYLEIKTSEDRRLIFVFVNRPACENAASTNHLFEELDSLALTVNADFLIDGDLNIAISKVVPSANVKRLEGLMKSGCLVQLGKGKTRITSYSARTINHLLCRPIENFIDSEPIEICFSDHRHSVWLPRSSKIDEEERKLPETSNSQGKKQSEFCENFGCYKLELTNWSGRFGLGLDLSWRNFQNHILRLIGYYFPYKKKLQSKRDPE